MVRARDAVRFGGEELGGCYADIEDVEDKSIDAITWRWAESLSGTSRNVWRSLSAGETGWSATSEKGRPLRRRAFIRIAVLSVF